MMPDRTPRTHKEMWLEDAVRINMDSFVTKFSTYGYTEREIGEAIVDYFVQAQARRAENNPPGGKESV
jgi:hypothetical protein